MSGGLYGRGKAPERACLPFSQWPKPDRRLWLAACAPGDVLDDDAGARSSHGAVTNRKAEKGYGRWLTYLQLSAPEALALPAADRITRERVGAFVERLIEIGNSTQTILARLQELGEVAKVMGPDRGWAFINALASKIRARHRPARDKSNLRLSNELVDLGFELMESADSLSGLEAALNEQIPSCDVKGVVERLRAGDAAVRIAEIEERFDYQRKAIGLKRGPELLAHLIEGINRPIKSWLELDRCNHGGRPSNVTRDYLLIRLAESAREILGDKPTTTANGPFHRMCGYVFPACGLDAEGLEKAIERTLKKHKSMFWKKQVKNTDGEP